MHRRWRIRLHLQASERRAAAVAIEGSPGGLSRAPMSSRLKANVLVVDDEPRSLQAMLELLAGPDRNIVAAESGKDALRRILKTDFAIILLDVRMPEMDGFETAALIRKLKRTRDTPIVFLTGAVED